MGIDAFDDSADHALLEENSDLRVENERLRALIAQVEKVGNSDSMDCGALECPWCRGIIEYDGKGWASERGHRRDCPAFSGVGQVRIPR